MKGLQLSALSRTRVLPYMLTVGGVIGLIASMTLTYDVLQSFQNPAYQPSCNLNPILSCESVMKTEQASVFGVPNTLFGLIGFGMLTMFGLALLAGATFKRWLWLAAQIAALAGVVFMHYLFFQSVFRIGAVCPWCFVVWMITIPIFWGITVRNVRARLIRLPAWMAAFIDKHSGDVLGMWYVGILVTLLVKFWYYWETLL